MISPAEAKALIENPDPAKRPVVLDTRGGYKDYFRGHLPTAHHLNFDTLPGVVLVDARPYNEFIGDDDVWLRKRHIPGAVSFHWAKLIEASNTHKFKPFSEVKAQLEAAGITPDKEVLCYCGTSREGSLLRFYLKHVAGYPKVRLYEGAWKEYVWLKGKSLPAQTGGKGKTAAQ